VPWIDLNLRTVAKKEGRAIAGLSMGGFGAIHYAELYSRRQKSPPTYNFIRCFDELAIVSLLRSSH